MNGPDLVIGRSFNTLLTAGAEALTDITSDCVNSVAATHVNDAAHVLSLSVTYLHTLERLKAAVSTYPGLKQSILPCAVRGIVFGHVIEQISYPSWLLSQ